MGCSASANVSNTVVPRHLSIITESGKTFQMLCDKYSKVSTIKQHMEMCIASKSNYLRLFLKVEVIGTSSPATAPSSASGESPQDQELKELEGKSTIVQEGDKSYRQIELEDDKLIIQYAKILAMSPRIYLSQHKPQNFSSESVSTSVNSNRNKNQTIHLGSSFIKQDNEIYVAIEKLENGEQITQSQIDILQKGRTSLVKQQSQPQAQPASPQKLNDSNLKQSSIQHSQSSLPQIQIEAN